MRNAVNDSLEDLEHALEHGHSHHHHDDHDEEPQAPYVRGEPKIGRNDPCPCGSGKKFKKCHGA
ncbi:MAG TPA: SEC-C metal-binding domain-containing protein [Myxococcota bacterium]|nr:SEC-C metal-binding domain-containing protein [Myxococcota bacterium]